MAYCMKSIIYITAGSLLLAADIHDAAWKGDLELVKKLAEENNHLLTAVDNRNCTPLHYACDGGHSDIVEFLLNNGVETDRRDVDGDTGLHWASFAGHPAVVKLLLESYLETVRGQGQRSEQWLDYFPQEKVG